MLRRPPLACPRCAAERSRESSWAARICEGCGVEFRPRGRVPIRVANAPPQRIGWGATLAIAGIAAAVGVRMAMESPSSNLPPDSIGPVVIQPVILPPLFDPSAVMQPLESPSVDVVTHRLERHEGRVEATGLLAISSRSVARPQVHVGFFGSNGEEIGAVLGHVACSRLDTMPCPWGFSGSEPRGTSEIRIRASGETDIGDLHPVARLRFSFDDEFEATNIEASPAEFEMAEAELIANGRGRELEVRVSLPEQLRLRGPTATLVGYAQGSLVELVVPLPSPVGLSRKVELPKHERAIVRWQLWIDGSVDDD
jgi:hypothetical protein